MLIPSADVLHLMQGLPRNLGGQLGQEYDPGAHAHLGQEDDWEARAHP